MYCKLCSFENKHVMCGQGFTSYICEKCGKEYTHHNTNTPKVCPECSEKLNICQQCSQPLGDNVNIKEILGEIPEVAKEFVKLQFCEYPFYVIPKDITKCPRYENCNNLGGCIYLKKKG